MTVTIEPLSEADGGGWMARDSTRPGCMSDGETWEEAAFNLADACHCWDAAAAHRRGDLQTVSLDEMIAQITSGTNQG